MSIQFRSFAFVSFSLLALACSDEDPQAQGKCESFVTSYCDRVVSCADNAGVLDGSYGADDLRSDCEQSVGTDAQCDEAVQVSPDYGQCMRDAKTLSCDDISDAFSSNEEIPLPDSCHGVVLHD